MKCKLLFLLLATLFEPAAAQVPIPMGGYDGFLQGARTAPIQLEAFFDLLCPDCKAAWPVMKELMQRYGKDTLGFTLHTFPLPYHHNAFYANQGVHVVAQNRSDLIWNYVDMMFAQQDSFGNAVTVDKTPTEVMATMGTLTQTEIGFAAAAFVMGLNTRALDLKTRTSWKYACSRGVAGTPTFLVNGVVVAGQPSWSVSDWTSVLDPLLPGELRASLPRAATNYTCPSGEETCEYLPGQAQCCTPGEKCIKNVGCRC